ncbi:hypothetical protein QU38_01815, partial [Staphylococcus aureus]
RLDPRHRPQSPAHRERQQQHRQQNQRGLEHEQPGQQAIGIRLAGIERLGDFDQHRRIEPGKPAGLGDDANVAVQIAGIAERGVILAPARRYLRQVAIAGQRAALIPDRVIDIVARRILQHPEDRRRQVERDLAFLDRQRIGDPARRCLED